MANPKNFRFGAAQSFTQAEIDTLDVVLRGLTRGQDLSIIAKQRAPELRELARKAARMSKTAAARREAAP